MKKIYFIFLCFASSLFAQSPLNYLTSTDGGSAYEICLYNSYLYVGCANTLEVWDLNGPGNTPGSMLFKERFLSNIDQLLVKNGFLYICANHDGLYKYDLNPDPANPVYKSHLVPANINESVYDIAFYGDTVAVASKNKLMLYVDGTSVFSYISTIANFTGSTRIHGVDIKNNMLAYTVGFSSTNGQDGVYLYNLSTMTPLDFYSNEIGNAWEVYFGNNNQLLHVMGGQIGSSSQGYYYALDCSDPNNLLLVFEDTIQSLGIGFACPMSANVINDTIYIATQGGMDLSTFGQYSVYVYDAADSGNIHFITDIHAGLYHFDIEISPSLHRMYVASEWYGIFTVDITDIFNENDLGKTLTGGWCHGSAYSNGKLVEASEGYGIRLFDASMIQSPVLINEDTAIGFCRAVAISDPGDFIYGWFLTNKGLRVYDSNLTLIADTSADPDVLLPADFQKSRFQNNQIAVIEQVILENKRILIANVSDPYHPFLQAKRKKDSMQDLAWHNSGKLIGLSLDSMIVYDSLLNVLGGIKAPAFKNFKAFVIQDDTIYAFEKKFLLGNDELVKFYFDEVNDTFIQLSSTIYPLNSLDRIFMAADSGHIYISSTVDQLKAISKSSYSLVNLYDHGADYMFDGYWGVHDLYTKDGYIFLNEYMGQTSIFGAPNTMGLQESQQFPGYIYPNPCKNYFQIKLFETTESRIAVISMNGQLMYSTNNYGDIVKLDTENWPEGMYIVRIETENYFAAEKLIVIK